VYHKTLLLFESKERLCKVHLLRDGVHRVLSCNSETVCLENGILMNSFDSYARPAIMERRLNIKLQDKTDFFLQKSLSQLHVVHHKFHILLLLLLLLLLLQSLLQPLWVLACSTIVEYSQQEGFYSVSLPVARLTPNLEDQ